MSGSGTGTPSTPASAGAYAFSLGYDDIFDEAFERCGIDPATLSARHLMSALRSANLLMADWSARRISLFSVDEQTQTLTTGQGDDATPYTAQPGTILILEANVRRSGVDRPIFPISRSMYFAIAKKTQRGLPSNIWYNIAANSYSLWTVPENSTDVLRYKRLRRKQDVTTLGGTPDAPYVYYDAVCAGMAEKLSLKFAPDRFDKLKGLAAEALKIAQGADREFVDVSIEIGL